jgi:hypothetical protein
MNTRLLRRAKRLGLLFVLLVLLKRIVKTMSGERLVGRNDLDQCPHSATFYPHRWHGLPMKGCGGSHLSVDEAKKLAKPFEANDEKYVSASGSLDSVNLRYFWESVLGEHDSD